MLEKLQRYFLRCTHNRKDINKLVKLTAAEIVESANELAEEEIAQEIRKDQLIAWMPEEEEEQLMKALIVTALETSHKEEGESPAQQVEKLLSLVTEQQALVLRLRYGLENGVPRNLEEVGRMLGVTRERIRQIHVKGLHALQQHIYKEWRRTHLV